MIYWYDNGLKRSESFFLNGKLVGDENFGWRDDGGLEYQTYCSEDTNITYYFSLNNNVVQIVKSIDMRAFYEAKFCENGNLISIESLNIEQKNIKGFYCSGELKYVVSKNRLGAFIDEYTYYHKNGQIAIKGSFSCQKTHKSIKNGEWLYYNKDGMLRVVEKYENGVLIER